MPISCADTTRRQGEAGKQLHVRTVGTRTNMNVIRSRQAWVIVLAACLITGLAMSLRQVLGLYLRPVTMDLGIGREPFSNAIALANLVWGFGAILFGFLSD